MEIETWNRRYRATTLPAFLDVQTLCCRKDLPEVKNLRKVREALADIALACDGATYGAPHLQFGVPFLG